MALLDVSLILKTLTTGPVRPPRLWWSESEAGDMRARLRSIAGYAGLVGEHAERVIKDPRVFASEPAWGTWQCGPVLDLAFGAWLLQNERYASLAGRLMDRAASAERWGPVGGRSEDPIAAALAIAEGLELLSEFVTDDQLARYDVAAREKCFAVLPQILKSPELSEAERTRLCADSACAALGTLAPSDLLVEEVARAAGCILASGSREADRNVLSVARIGIALAGRSDEVAEAIRESGVVTTIPEPNPFAQHGAAVLGLLELPKALHPPTKR